MSKNEQPAQEPVAWRWKARQNSGKIILRTESFNPVTEGVPVDEFHVFDIEPLYTHPATSREPLSEVDIERIKEGIVDYDCGINDIRFARAIEKAHGIGE